MNEQEQTMNSTSPFIKTVSFVYKPKMADILMKKTCQLAD